MRRSWRKKEMVEERRYEKAAGVAWREKKTGRGSEKMPNKHFMSQTESITTE